MPFSIALLPVTRPVQGLLIAVLSIGLISLVWLYGTGLRDARYLDGWLLAAGMILQISFHLAVQRARISPKTMMRWRAFHIFLGYVLVAAFLSHTSFTLPDTGLEWALWSAFVLVAASAVFGTYLAWSLKARHGIDAGFNFERIKARREELARAAHVTATQAPGLENEDLALPALPYDAWILDLYTTHLRDFFHGPRHLKAHLIGSKRHTKRLQEEIDTLSRYVDGARQEKLQAIRDLVGEKDRLDFASVYLGLTQGWLLVHVPLTYALAVLTLLHGVVVYAFSSGAW